MDIQERRQTLGLLHTKCDLIYPIYQIPVFAVQVNVIFLTGTHIQTKPQEIKFLFPFYRVIILKTIVYRFLPLLCHSAQHMLAASGNHQLSDKMNLNIPHAW